MNFYGSMRTRSSRFLRLPQPLVQERVSSSSRGFSLIEMIIVVCIALIAAAIGFITMRPVLKNSRADVAYQVTLAQLRNARNLAVTNRKTYRVVFTAPNRITTTRLDAGVPTTVVADVLLPMEVSFNALAGIPNTNATTPDNMG